MDIIAGVDEAGRGPLAGPVVAAAVILPDSHTIDGLRDSKKLSKKKRSELYNIIYDQATGVGVGEVDVKTIDQINIREATLQAMQIAVGNLPNRPTKLLIDGHPLKNQVIPNEGIVGGDDLIDSIKAASIIAKVHRDKLMAEYGCIFPEYGFENHNGYGTEFHLNALKENRATPIHRRSFKPVSNKMPTLSWLSEQNKIGWMGEKLAALYLKGKGFKIVEMNRDCSPHGEINIISIDKDETVFVEVKTEYKSNSDLLYKKVNSLKLQKLVNAIQFYQNQTEQIYTFRIDFISVVLENKNPIIKYFEGISVE
ncbi:MAG: ribonuclease HII [Candidatus Marinimicrobia bacterium]|nr:ribonuclease HII [Candidatus Neomarinimicrobiota bacterium]